MTGFYIIFIVILIFILLYRSGGNELKKRLNAFGGIKTIYEPLVSVFLGMPNAHLISEKPSSIEVAGKYKDLNYFWKLHTPDGKKITIRFNVSKDNKVVEKKIFDFPISSEWPPIKIIAVLHHNIDHKEILEE